MSNIRSSQTCQMSDNYIFKFYYVKYLKSEILIMSCVRQGYIQIPLYKTFKIKILIMSNIRSSQTVSDI